MNKKGVAKQRGRMAGREGRVKEGKEEGGVKMRGRWSKKIVRVEVK